MQARFDFCGRGEIGRWLAALEPLLADVEIVPRPKPIGALRRIGRELDGYCLDFLGGLFLEDALAWLERHPGVGRKVAASTLNVSTLDRPVLIVDSHVLRVLLRLGFVAASADARTASEAATAAMPGWSGEEWLRFHIAAKRLGQLACHAATPDCSICPLAPDCPGRLTR